MKKILYTFLAFCAVGTAFADIDFADAINNTSMPTDAEIRRILSQFNFSEDQKEELFKETKKKLQQMYSGKNMEQTNAELNQYYSVINNEELNQYMDNSTKQELKKGISKYTRTTSD